ncbi:sterol desaturase family protein [Neptunomonas sp.]|uniref:sterol desaturase family protein n=1 Tax=Neptunomonas sp. TaxID=1971898 RepID=UPI00356B5205
MTTISAAIYFQENTLGLFHLLNLNFWFAFVIGFFIYDLFHYSIHRVFHKVPVLWKLHRLHHTDPDVDVSTELKHHPFELVVTVVSAVVVVFVFGIPPVSIILCSLFAQVVSLISHANIKIAESVDTPIRKVFVTPAMHRIHHSAWQPETDSNYGVLFSFWDRWFGTYVDKPLAGYEGMKLGLDGFRSPRDLWLDKLLLQPFRRHVVVPALKSEPVDKRNNA